MKTTGAMWDAKVSDGSSQHPLEISGVKVTAWAESRLPVSEHPPHWGVFIPCRDGQDAKTQALLFICVEGKSKNTLCLPCKIFSCSDGQLCD